MAHELQHAVEIADTPAIVDGASLAREYQRIGYRQSWPARCPVSRSTPTPPSTPGSRCLRELMQEE